MIKTLMFMIALTVANPPVEQPIENEFDSAVSKISEAVRESIKNSVEESTQGIVKAILGKTKSNSVGSSVRASSIVGLTRYPDKPGHGMGMVRSPKPGGWVVFKSGVDGFEFVQSVTLEGNSEDGFLTVTFQEKPGTYGVLFLEKGVTQPQVINVTIGKILSDPDPVDPINPVNPNTNNKLTYVYEQSEQTVPKPIQLLLRKLNKDGIQATAIDDDGETGLGSIPIQYKNAISSAREIGIPCLIVENNGKVTLTVKDPNEQDLAKYLK